MSPRYSAPWGGGGDAVHGYNGERGARGKGRMRTKEAKASNHRMVIRGHRAAIFETLIERINRETNWPRN